MAYKRVIVGMSGGVDSSVAALLLLERGHAIEGLFMKNWEEDDTEGYCAAEEDLHDAEGVCAQLAIPLRTVNFSHEYWEGVFEHFLAEYRAGRTPNPDVMCNKEIKFKAFLDHALALGADGIATGHYARIEHRKGRCVMLAGLDDNKDQTYFLYTLGQHALARTRFPLGGLHKSEVRRIAREAGFANHAKKDSTGLCFIGERPFRAFLNRYLPAQPGELIDTEGQVLGRHEGLMFYTLGQRQGLGIGGRHDAAPAPWYVVGKDLARNRLIVAQGSEHPALYHRRLEAGQLHWVAGDAQREPGRCTAKVRYRQVAQPCTVELDETARRVQVIFEAPQRAITPGQSVVFYEGPDCLGGGIIETFSD